MSKYLFFMAVLSVCGCAQHVVATESLKELDHLGKVPAFSFKAHDGGTVSEADLPGKITVLDFFFTSCTGVCPTMKANLAKVRKAFLHDPEVECLSITVDPERDTVTRLSDFWKQHGSLEGWRFATGEKTAIYKLAREGLHLGASEVPGDILHSDRFLLIDKTGELRGYYHGTELSDVDKLIEHIRLLKSEK